MEASSHFTAVLFVYFFFLTLITKDLLASFRNFHVPNKGLVEEHKMAVSLGHLAVMTIILDHGMT